MGMKRRWGQGWVYGVASGRLGERIGTTLLSWDCFMTQRGANELAIFELIHQASRDASGSNRQRRARPRWPFPAIQRVVPYEDGPVPPLEDFAPVRCMDLSRSGIAFLSPEPPAAENLLVALGKPPAVRYVTAHVVHQRTVYLVGCSFGRRVEG